jgi:hypothetical protein
MGSDAFVISEKGSSVLDIQGDADVVSGYLDSLLPY